MKRIITLLVLAGLLTPALALHGCLIVQRDAIAVSNPALDFALNELALPFQVWNNNPDVEELTIQVSPSDPWILTGVNSVASAPPGPGGTLDKETITVRIDRSQLSEGMHEGFIELSAPGITPVQVAVLVEQGPVQTGDPLNIVNPTFRYSVPFLIDFEFALEDEDGNAVVAEPVQFEVIAREGARDVPPGAGLELRRGAAQQLVVELVLDYSLSIQQSEGAIEAMETAIKEMFLPALNADALVGITEFHREDDPAMRVADFTVDRDFLRQRVDAIQEEFVQGFPALSRMFDALNVGISRFDEGDPDLEERVVILFSDGIDTSSVLTANEVVDNAQARGVRIFTVGIGDEVEELTLLNLSTSTGGAFFSTASVDDLDAAFQRIIDNLGAEYVLRWASPRRRDEAFFPSFNISIMGATAEFTAPEPFRPPEYAGDVTRGSLRLVPSDTEAETTVFLRADYVPRNIDRLSFLVETTEPFTVDRVSAVDDGLLAGWDLERMDTPEGVWIDVTSPGAPIPFATFGALLRFEFDTVVEEPTDLFTAFTVDNSIYITGQHFVVEGFEDGMR